MRVHTVASLAAVGMGLTSVAVWMLAPVGSASEASVTNIADGPNVVAADGTDIGTTNIGTPGTNEPADRSHFTTGATLMLEGRVGHARMQADRDQSTYVLATITGGQNSQAPASPLDLTIVIDASGSMRGAPLVNAINGASGMIRRLRDNDRVGVVTYSNEARTIVPATVIDAFSRERVISMLGTIQANGGTCISCGMDLAMSQIFPQNDRVTRILLLSDGDATAGVRDVTGFQQIAERARAMNTTVSTIGVDVSYNQVTMGTLAQFSNGRHYFAENAAALPPIFDQEFESLSATLANNVEVTVELAPGVFVEEIFDRAVRREGNRLIAPLGTLGPGQEKTFLVGVRVPAGSAPERAIADVRLTYDDLATHNRGECSGSLAARTTNDATLASSLDPFVATRLSRSETTRTIREANDMAARGDVAGANAHLEQTQRRVASRTRALRASPQPMAPALARDFERQSAALDNAGGGFRSGGGEHAPAQMRRNEALASPLAE
jgi:Ca-activated chloride channel family protein